jgi:DNA-binding beta-propeller fold protein YncE
LLAAGQAPVAPAAGHFQFQLDHAAALTSAGIYDELGRLVRVLWTMKPHTAGAHHAEWDGRDDNGVAAPAGRYTFKVAVNRATYRNLGVIGNSGQPANTFGHVPINFEAVATDADGFIYTVHDWDEPHHDVIRWDPATGKVASHSGHPVGALVKAIALDDTFAYVATHAKSGVRSNSQFTIVRLRMDKTPGSTKWAREPFGGKLPQIDVYNGHAEIPEGTSKEDRDVMWIPILSLAVKDDLLLATDALAGKLRRYDKVTGEARESWGIPLPQAVAVAPDGRVWVGHQHNKVSVFGANGKIAATPIQDLGNVQSLAFGSDGRLYVGDAGNGEVRIYQVAGNKVEPTGKLGQKAEPGERAADRFRKLHGLAVDRHGNIITLQNEWFFNGGRIAKFSPKGALLWEQYGLEFASNGAYDPNEPDMFYSFMHHVYRLDRKTGASTYLGNSFTPGDPHGPVNGSLRITRIGGQNFCFMATGDGVQIFRIDPPTKPDRGPVLKLASILGRCHPLPTGEMAQQGWKPENRYLWSWHDEKGTGKPVPDDCTYFARPEDRKPLWQYGPFTVDASNTLWFASADRGGNTIEKSSVWKIPLRGVNQRGDPLYDWRDAQRVVPTTNFLWKATPKLVHHSADENLTYVLGHTPRKDAPQDGGLHMGGNTLAAFNAAGESRWQVLLPKVSVGLDAIPGSAGGCIVGSDPGAGVCHHYTRDGLLVGIFGPDPQVMGAKPNNPSGLLDCMSAIQVQRDPRDGLLDVFVEDDFNLRIAWYRVNDRPVQTLCGPVNR